MNLEKTLCKQCHTCETFTFKKIEKYNYNNERLEKKIEFLYCKGNKDIITKKTIKIINKKYIGYILPRSRKQTNITNLFKKNNKNIVTYINKNTQDIRLKNLREITRSCLNQENIKGPIIFPGVYQVLDYFESTININGKTEHLGYYETDLNAYHAFLVKCIEISREINKETEAYKIYKKKFDINKFKKRELNQSSKYRNVMFHKKTSKWRASIHYKNKIVFDKYFEDEDDAHLAVERKRKELKL